MPLKSRPILVVFLSSKLGDIHEATSATVWYSRVLAFNIYLIDFQPRSLSLLSQDRSQHPLRPQLGSLLSKFFVYVVSAGSIFVWVYLSSIQKLYTMSGMLEVPSRAQSIVHSTGHNSIISHLVYSPVPDGNSAYEFFKSIANHKAVPKAKQRRLKSARLIGEFVDTHATFSLTNWHVDTVTRSHGWRNRHIRLENAGTKLFSGLVFSQDSVSEVYFAGTAIRMSHDMMSVNSQPKYASSFYNWAAFRNSTDTQ